MPFPKGLACSETSTHPIFELDSSILLPTIITEHISEEKECSYMTRYPSVNLHVKISNVSPRVKYENSKVISYFYVNCCKI